MRYRKLVNRLKAEEGRICLVSHEHPDGDAVGSLIGFYSFLKNAGKNVVPVLKDDIPYFLDYLEDWEDVQQELPSEFDLCILLDASDFSRTGFARNFESPIIRIDHHKTGESYSEFDIVEEKAPAVGSLILKLIKKWDESMLSQDIGRALFTAILTDTVSFTHANSLKWAFEDAAYLTAKNIKVNDIGSLVYERKRKVFYDFLERALASLDFAFEGRIAYTVLEKKDFEDIGGDFSDTEGIVRYPISIIGVEAGFSFMEKDYGSWRISARGKGKFDLASLCEEFGGGGHKNAAGCALRGKRDEVIGIFMSTLSKYMKGT